MSDEVYERSLVTVVARRQYERLCKTLPPFSRGFPSSAETGAGGE